MSEENVEIVRHSIKHLSETGEIDRECYHPEVVFKTRSDGPAPDTHHGLDGLQRGWENLQEAWEEIIIDLREIVDTDAAIVAVLDARLRSRRGGIEPEAEESWAFWVRDGKIRRVEQHGSRHEALEAAVLSE